MAQSCESKAISAEGKLVLIRVNGGSSSDEIDGSLEIVRGSQDVLERTEKLLSRNPLYEQPILTA